MANPATIGSEFQVNTHTANGQADASVTGLANGGFVVTWESTAGQDSNGNGVFGQRYNADGTVNGAEFQVNSHTTNHQDNPSVAALADGGFVITWESSAQDGSFDGVYGQRYNADGTDAGTEFQINSETVDSQFIPSITSLTDGKFVVTWRSDAQDGSFGGIFGQRFNADGTDDGAEFQVNTYTTLTQSAPSITSFADGSFVIVWESAGQDGSNNSIYAQRYNADGTTNGAEFKVNTFATLNQQAASVTSLADGGFVVTWQSYNQDAGVSDFGVFGQRYNGDGTVNGTEFQINTYTADHQDEPDVTALADGGFVVTWTSADQDGDDNGVYGQRFNADGTKNGIEFLINNETSNNQDFSSISVLANGNIVVVWDSFNQDAGGTDDGVFGQRFSIDLFTAGDDTIWLPSMGGPWDALAGNDTIVGSDSADTITLGAGNDEFDGGAADDTVKFSGNWADYTITEAGGTYTVVDNRAGSPDGTDSLTNVEFFEFANGTTPAADALTDDPTDITNVGNAVVENSAAGTVVATLSAVDPNPLDTHTFALTTSSSLFEIVGNEIRVKAGANIDFETATSHDLDVQVTDAAGATYSQTVTISVTDVNEVLTHKVGDDSAETITGDAGDDYIEGKGGADTINGGDGSDWLYGGAGDDTINAGAGAMDVSLGDDGNDTINGEGGMDYMYGYAGNDTAHGGDGDDVAYGGAGNDELYGDAGADWLFGEAGDDKLFGGAGADILMGGAGTDEITGGKGNDWMWGGDMAGAGDNTADTFFFGADWGGDVIWDFEDGKDILDVSGAGITSFADLTIGTFGQFTTITSASGDIIYLRGAGDVAIAESAITGADFIFA